MADRFHWLWEWLLSHLAWEGLKWIIPPAAVAMVVAIIATVLHWITGHASIVQVTLTFIGSILVTALIVGREKARRIAPRLKSYEARSEGLYDIQDNIIGFTQRIENDQRRFHTIAHNVRASLEFRHSLGDRVRVSPALWIVTEPTGKRRLTDSVSIGMGEQRSLLILFWHNADPVLSALTTSRIPINRQDASHLALGEWTVKIVLQGDNVKSKSKNRLSLGPHSVTMQQT